MNRDELTELIWPKVMTVLQCTVHYFLKHFVWHSRECPLCRAEMMDEWNDWLTDIGGEG